MLAVIAALVWYQTAPAQSANAQATVSDSVPRLQIRLGHTTVVSRELRDTIELTADLNGDSIAGFDFTIAVDHPGVSITEILRGALPDSCAWEYFTARRLEPRQGMTMPLTTWQIVGLARFVGKDADATCYSMDGTVSLARLVLSGPPVGAIPDTSIALFFLWADCTDNVVSGPSGAGLLMSGGVIDCVPTHYTSDKAFPARAMPASCINPRARIRPQQRLAFHNGAVTLRAVAERVTFDSATSPRDSAGLR